MSECVCVCISAAIDTFVSDPVTSGEMDDGEKEKVFRRVRTMYDG